MAKRLHTAHSTIGHWETGVRTPSEDDVRRYVRVLREPESIVDDWLDEQAVAAISEILSARRLSEPDCGAVAKHAELLLREARGRPPQDQRQTA